MKQIEYFGFNSIENLEHILKNENSKNIFLITGKKSFKSCGAESILKKTLKNKNIIRFNGFSPNPQLKDIIRGYSVFQKQNPDTIIAVGGGSSIDVAKAIKLFNYNNSNKKIPLIAIPTTAGSGSEATYFIVCYDKKQKQSKGKQNLTLPNYSICDPQFTMSLPKNIAASSGIDALSQAIESYWSINSTKKSKNLSKQAISLLIDNLEGAVNKPTKQNKENIMKAANLAGKAINLTRTTACHSIAYPITSYFGVVHGQAVALTLGEMLIYNSKISETDCLDKSGVNYVKKSINELLNLIKTENPPKAKNKIENLMKNIGLETRLSKLGLEKQDLEIIIEKGFALERVKNNPRLLTKENLRKILNKIY